MMGPSFFKLAQGPFLSLDGSGQIVTNVTWDLKHPLLCNHERASEVCCVYDFYVVDFELSSGLMETSNWCRVRTCFD